MVYLRLYTSNSRDDMRRSAPELLRALVSPLPIVCWGLAHVNGLVLVCVQKGLKSPMDLIQAAEPIKVSGSVVASYGSE